MERPIRTLAIFYASLIALAAIWAWYVDITMLHSQREHLLPDIVLAFLSLPSSISLGSMYKAWPVFFSKPLTQVAWITLCGFGQAAVLWFLPKLFATARRR
jgi:hypothetical protein